MAYPYKPKHKWDVHTHTTTSPDTYEALSKFTHYEQFIRVRAHEKMPCCAEMVDSNGNVQRVIEDNAYDGAARLKDCDKHGVTFQVLSPTPMMIPDYVYNKNDAVDICRILNDESAKLISKFPKRFTALGAVPMMFPDDAIKEMERIKENKLWGIEVNSNINGLDLDDPMFFPIFEAAYELNLAVFIHPWGGFMSPTEERLKKRMSATRNWRPWLIGMGMETALAFDSMRCGRVHERLPDLRVMYAHGGGAFTGLIGRLEHGAYCRPDLFKHASNLDPYETVRQCRVYTDTLTHSPWGFETLVNTIGVNRIAMGSDYPYPLGEIEPFDEDTGLDPKGNMCPYKQVKGIYPGHMIEFLPRSGDDMKEAWQHFPWIPHFDAGGNPRKLPCLTNTEKQRVLSGTAREWLGYPEI